LLSTLLKLRRNVFVFKFPSRSACPKELACIAMPKVLSINQQSKLCLTNSYVPIVNLDVTRSSFPPHRGDNASFESATYTPQESIDLDDLRNLHQIKRMRAITIIRVPSPPIPGDTDTRLVLVPFMCSCRPRPFLLQPQMGQGLRGCLR
jgi:hypothetical protein